MSDSNMIGKEVTVTVDRPLGTPHPKYREMIYPINYGYIKNVFAPDGDEQDAYILGIDTPVATFTGVIIAIIERHDDIEEKWVVAPKEKRFTLEEIKAGTYFTEQYYESVIRIK